MPEFVMEGRDHAARAESAFVLGFIEAMFFTENSPAYCSEEWFSDECRHAVEEGQSDGNLPGDVGYTDLHPDSLKAIRAFCERKQREMSDLLALAYERDGYDETQAGRDLLYTYVGHGVGYWDREQLEADGLGNDLTDACGRGEVNPFFGGHVTYGNAPFVHVEGL